MRRVLVSFLLFFFLFQPVSFSSHTQSLQLVVSRHPNSPTKRFCEFGGWLAGCAIGSMHKDYQQRSGSQSRSAHWALCAVNGRLFPFFPSKSNSELCCSKTLALSETVTTLLENVV